MEFWGVEVKPGEDVKCDPGFDKYLHLSQASLGEVKKEKEKGKNESTTLFVKFGDKKLVIGTLSSEKSAHISFDLIFEKEFELSHNWKNGSVYFCGYTTIATEESNKISDSDSDEDVPTLVPVNGKADAKKDQSKPSEAKVAPSKPESSGKHKVKVAELKRESVQKDEESDEEDEDESDEEDASIDEESDDDESGDEEEDSSEEDKEVTPKKVELGKKKSPESVTKTPVPEKKAKLVSPTDGKRTGGDAKKIAHVATPYPSKQAGKFSAINDKSKQQTPKSNAQVSCKSCNRTFNSENALQSHTKAKHSAAK